MRFIFNVLVTAVLVVTSAAIGPARPQGSVRQLASGAGQITTNLLMGKPWYQGVPQAMVTGGFIGGITGSVGWGIKQWVTGQAAGSSAAMTEGVVYRGGSDTPANLTPRPGIDTTGLSTWDTLEAAVEPGGKAQVIDVSKLQPPLAAIPDAPPPGHVSITPSDPELIAQWAATRGTETVHPLTQIVKDAIIGVIRRLR